jgi:hypothetical protein
MEFIAQCVHQRFAGSAPMEDAKKNADKRRFPRFSGDMTAMKFRRLASLPSGEPDIYHVGHVIDISKGGMYFATDHAITRGEKIEYYVGSPGGKGGREGTGRIVRVNREPERFFVAVEFRA